MVCFCRQTNIRSTASRRMNLIFVIMILILAILTAVYCAYEMIDIFKEIFNEKYMRHRRGNKKNNK